MKVLGRSTLSKVQTHQQETSSKRIFYIRREMRMLCLISSIMKGVNEKQDFYSDVKVEINIY